MDKDKLIKFIEEEIRMFADDERYSYSFRKGKVSAYRVVLDYIESQEKKSEVVAPFPGMTKEEIQAWFKERLGEYRDKIIKDMEKKK